MVTGEDFDLIKHFHDASIDRVIVWPPLATSEEEMGRELERIAEAVRR